MAWINVETNDGKSLYYNLKFKKGFLLSSEFIKKNNNEKIKEIIAKKENEFSTVYENKKIISETKITILPTFSCNLKCEYCFENEESRYNKIPELNKEEYLLKIIEFIRNNKQVKNEKNLTINWYGGEPLLQYEFIKNATLEINKNFPDKKIQYYLITNGFLLDEVKCKELKGLGLNTIHLTLDGNEEKHNTLKKTLDGNQTFKRIFNNLVVANNYFDIILRINVNRLNQQSIFDLLDQLKNISTKNRIYLEFKRLSLSNSEDKRFLDINEYMDIYPKYIHTCISNNLNVSILDSRINFCSALSEKNFVIEPNGSIRKCYEEIGNEDTTLTDLDNSFLNRDEQNIWDNYSVDDKCNKCTLYEICGGGCPKYKVRDNSIDCRYTLEGVKSLILDLYHNMHFEI